MAQKWLLYSLLLVIISATAQFEPLPYQQSEALLLAKKIEPIEVLILENPMTQMQIGSGVKWGIDEERLQDFSMSTGLKIRTKKFKNSQKLIDYFNSGKGQLVVSRKNLNLQGASEGPPLEEVETGIFCHIKSIKNKSLPDMTLEKQDHKAEITIQKILKNKVDCLQSEIRYGAWATQMHPEIKLFEKLKADQHYAWQIRHSSPELKVLLNSWYRKSLRQQKFQAINHRFDKTLTTLDSSDIRTFLKKSQQILPDYQEAFKEASREVKLPWSLLAAVAYQESQWNPDAVSYTGVKGLMQLTLQAAQHMNVSDREDPFESIWGGSRYLKHLWQEWAEVQNSHDRLIMTLASYNIGIAHMFDVVELLESRGQSPYKWHNIEKVLPELENEEVHSKLRYGFARGRETVDFVNRTYAFYQILSTQKLRD